MLPLPGQFLALMREYQSITDEANNLHDLIFDLLAGPEFGVGEMYMILAGYNSSKDRGKRAERQRRQIEGVTWMIEHLVMVEEFQNFMRQAG